MARLPENLLVTVQDVFDDFRGRRGGLIRALTIDVDEFYQACDPEKENMYLYANPDGSWKVTVPVKEVPTELPEPTLGINFARDGMRTNDWLAFVAIHSDSWLYGVASYLGARAGLGRHERRELFKLINKIPTVFEAWSSFLYRPTDQPSKDNDTTKPDPRPKVVPKGKDTRDVGQSSALCCCFMKKFVAKAFR